MDRNVPLLTIEHRRPVLVIFFMKGAKTGNPFSLYKKSKTF